jgi:hypothetical protein
MQVDLASPVSPRQLEGIAHDPLRARARHQLEHLCDLRGLLVLDPGVEVLLVLPNHDEVHVRTATRHEGGKRSRRPNVGKEIQGLANGDVEALVATTLGCRDRCLQEHRIAPDHLPRLRRQARRMACQVGALPNFDLLEPQSCPRGIEDPERGVEDLRTDTVAPGDRHGQRSRV